MLLFFKIWSTVACDAAESVGVLDKIHAN
jgi:hypothetical protein